MKSFQLSIIFLLLFKTYSCQNIKELFEKINADTIKFNAKAAEIAWESSINPGNPDLPERAANYQKKRIKWQQKNCDQLVALNNDLLLNNTQRRQTYLFCRGPKFTYDEARETSSLYEELQSIYSDAEICIPISKTISRNNLTDIEIAILNYMTSVKQLSNSKRNNSVELAAKTAAAGRIEKDATYCLNGEDQFEKMMKFSRNEQVLRWLWLVWREKVGPPMKRPYERLVQVENRAARQNGYTDIGATWRDELEIPTLRQLCRHLYGDIKPLYSLLHGVMRFYLRREYGNVVPERGPIPAHLLGNLWAQNWESLADLIIPTTINIDESIKNSNWTVTHMVKRTEDFYQSLGLPAMTDTFWHESVFARENHRNARCHGTAADMFKYDDYRMLYCAGTLAEDFYVLHHEMGHIQYYMAYQHQPGIFRQANTALHESIGDTIMYGVMTPQHLHRLGLVNDSILYPPNDFKIDKEPVDLDIETKNDHSLDKTETNENIQDIIEDKPMKIITTDTILMLKLALNKLPQIPFALLIDEYRWKYFEGTLDDESLNREFWKMALKLQGIAPPNDRGEEYFDVGAKFHVPDNTPYIRYFLSSFIQHQLFETLCKAAVFGRRDVLEDLPDTITMNRCDIYGSKAVGKILKDLMSRGNSQHWREILEATTGKDEITASALKRYYRPLYKVLVKLVRAYRIPIGW